MVTNSQEKKYEMFIDWVEDGQKQPLFYKNKYKNIRQMENRQPNTPSLIIDCNVYFSDCRDELDGIEITTYDSPLFCMTYDQKMNAIKEYVKLTGGDNDYYSPYYILDIYNMDDIENFGNEPLDALVKLAKKDQIVFAKEQIRENKASV